MALEIPLPEPEKPDIFSYGFDDFLYRGTEAERNPLIYDSVNDAVNPSLISAGEILAPITIDSLKINSLQGGSLISIQGWQFSGTFSASNVNTVAWTAGTITLQDGTAFSISAGNTGVMAALTYIYFSKTASETVLQTTTTAATAVGANKILIAVAKNNTDTGATEATFQVFGGSGGGLFMSDNIAANSITSNEIAANTITANEIATGTITATQIATGTITADRMNVSQLSAIAADLGTITAGTVTGATIRTAASGARVVLDSSNFLQAWGANKMRAQLVTDELRFYNDTIGDTKYVAVKAVDETLGGLAFHSLKFVESWGSGNRTATFGFHLLPEVDSTWDLGLQEAGGVIAWRSVYTDEVVTDKIDLLNNLRLDLPAKISSSFGIYATDTAKYLNIDTNQGDVGATGIDATHGPSITTDYHVIRFITDAGGDTGHIVAGGGSTIGAEVGTLGESSHTWILMYADGTNGRIQTGGYNGGAAGGALILSPASGNVVMEDSDNLLMYQESGKYFSIEPSGGFLNITSSGFSGTYGIKFKNYLWMDTGIDIRCVGDDAGSNIGDSSERFSNIYGIDLWGTLHAYDVIMDNGWNFTENNKIGIQEKGLAIIDENKKIKIFIGENGIYADGKIKDLKNLK